LSSFNPTLSSSTSDPESPSSTDSSTQHSTDTLEDVYPEDLRTFSMKQEQHWIDATTDECLEDVPAATDESLNLAMVCDIQRAISRLVGKAPQLIDRMKQFKQWGMLYLLKVILQLTLWKAVCTLGINLTEENKSIGFKVVPGRHPVLELD